MAPLESYVKIKNRKNIDMERTDILAYEYISFFLFFLENRYLKW